MKKFLAIAALLTLAACVSPQQQEAMRQAQMQRDANECASLGFRPNSQAMSECMLKLREIRATESNTRAVERSRMNDDWYWGRPYGRYPYWW